MDRHRRRTISTSARRIAVASRPILEPGCANDLRCHDWRRHVRNDDARGPEIERLLDPRWRDRRNAHENVYVRRTPGQHRNIEVMDCEGRVLRIKKREIHRAQCRDLHHLRRRRLDEAANEQIAGDEPGTKTGGFGYRHRAILFHGSFRASPRAVDFAGRNSCRKAFSSPALAGRNSVRTGDRV